MSSSGVTDLRGTTLHPGKAHAEALVLSEPLSFWGGTSPLGRIIDTNHPQHGQSIRGRVVVMEVGRGSSSSSTVLAEQLRSGHGPAALVLGVADPILVVGALVAAELYGIDLPIVLLDQASLRDLTRTASGPAPCLADVDAHDGAWPQASLSLTLAGSGPALPAADHPHGSQQGRLS